MTDWTSGYLADIGYTFGYYAELNPPARQAGLFERWAGLPRIRHRLRTWLRSRHEL